MANIVLVYHSVTGTTRRLAESIAGGVARVEHARVQLVEINPKDIIEGRYVNQSVLELVEKADAVAARLLRQGGIHKFKSNANPNCTKARDVLRSVTAQQLRKCDAKRVLATHVHLFPRGRGRRPKA